MKKLLSVALCGALALSLLTACGGNGGTTTTSNQAASGAFLGDFDISKYVTLGEYKDMEVQLTGSLDVTDEEVASYMESALEGFMNPTDADHAIGDGDTFSADYSGRMADTDEVFEGGTAEDVEITIGAGGYIDGFEEGFLGMVPGETKDVPLTFPEDYHSEALAGKDVIFTFTVNHHLEQATAWTDDLVASIGIDGVTTVADLKEYTKTMLTDSRLSELQSEAESLIMETVEGNCTFSDSPAEMLSRFEEQLRMNAEEMVEQYKEMGQEIDLEEMLESQLTYYGMSGTVDEMVTEYSDRVSKMMMMYYAIVQAEGLSVTDEEVQTQLTSVLEANGFDTVEAMNEEYKTDIIKELKESLFMERAQEFILHNNRAVDANGNPVELHTHDEDPSLGGGVGSDGSIGGE